MQNTKTGAWNRVGTQMSISFIFLPLLKLKGYKAESGEELSFVKHLRLGALFKKKNTKLGSKSGKQPMQVRGSKAKPH